MMRLFNQVVLGHLILITDLLGTAVFAAEGAATGIYVRLDILGVLVLALATALGGGLIRDILPGALHPSSIRDWRYAAIALLTGTVLFVLHTPSSKMNEPLLLAFDAAGLSLCAVTGATKALEYQLHPLLATLLGGIPGVGGGTVRDLLINRISSVLRADVYAAAALLGGVVVALLIKLKVRTEIAVELLSNCSDWYSSGTRIGDEGISLVGSPLWQLLLAERGCIKPMVKELHLDEKSVQLDDRAFSVTYRDREECNRVGSRLHPCCTAL